MTAHLYPLRSGTGHTAPSPHVTADDLAAQIYEGASAVEARESFRSKAQSGSDGTGWPRQPSRDQQRPT